MEICTVGSVREESVGLAMVDLNGHEAGNGRYSQGRPTARRVLLYSERCPVSAFYKGESQEKRLPGDWKEQRFLPGSPAQVMLGGSWGFSFFADSCCGRDDAFGSDATSSAVAKNANHSSI